MERYHLSGLSTLSLALLTVFGSSFCHSAPFQPRPLPPGLSTLNLMGYQRQPYGLSTPNTLGYQRQTFWAINAILLCQPLSALLVVHPSAVLGSPSRPFRCLLLLALLAILPSAFLQQLSAPRSRFFLFRFFSFCGLQPSPSAGRTVFLFLFLGGPLLLTIPPLCCSRLS
jgi:hypothetical protein